MGLVCYSDWSKVDLRIDVSSSKFQPILNMSIKLTKNYNWTLNLENCNVNREDSKITKKEIEINWKQRIGIFLVAKS